MQEIYSPREIPCIISEQESWLPKFDMNVHSLWPSELKGYIFNSQIKHESKLCIVRQFLEKFFINSILSNTRRELSYPPSKKTPCCQGRLHTYTQHKSLHFLNCGMDFLNRCETFLTQGNFCLRPHRKFLVSGYVIF